MADAPEIECTDCDGNGRVETGNMERGPVGIGFEAALCEACNGTGTIKPRLIVGRPCADVTFLLEMARYFEKRPTGGEDGAHWSNVGNAENCRRIAGRLALQSEGWRQYEPCTLMECPAGHFLFGRTLGFKTEYGASLGKDIGSGKVEWTVSHYPDAYVCESGEIFWGGVKTHEERASLIVIPVDAPALPAPPEG